MSESLTVVTRSMNCAFQVRVRLELVLFAFELGILPHAFSMPIAPKERNATGRIMLDQECAADPSIMADENASKPSRLLEDLRAKLAMLTALLVMLLRRDR